MHDAAVPTVFLVDDSTPIRERLKELLTLDARACIVGEADSAASAIRGIGSAHPDFVVLDYSLPDGTGLDVLRALDDAVRESVFIVLTNHASAPLRAACEASGARFFLDKSKEFDQLAGIIASSRSAEGVPSRARP